MWQPQPILQRKYLIFVIDSVKLQAWRNLHVVFNANQFVFFYMHAFFIFYKLKINFYIFLCLDGGESNDKHQQLRNNNEQLKEEDDTHNVSKVSGNLINEVMLQILPPPPTNLCLFTLIGSFPIWALILQVDRCQIMSILVDQPWIFWLTILLHLFK